MKTNPKDPRIQALAEAMLGRAVCETHQKEFAARPITLAEAVVFGDRLGQVFSTTATALIAAVVKKHGAEGAAWAVRHGPPAVPRWLPRTDAEAARALVGLPEQTTEAREGGWLFGPSGKGPAVSDSDVQHANQKLFR